MMKKLMLILSYLFISIGMIYAQTTTVSGTVVDETGMEVIGASVVVKGTTTGVATDIDGKFTLNVPNNSILVFSLVGMKKVEMKATPNMKVKMESDAALLEEVVVTGYGVTKKAAFTGASTVVGDNTLATRNDANAIKALDGNVPGLQMNFESGQPGAPANIFIRGRNSINSGTQPLYVIDGVPLSTDVMGTRKSEGKEISPLSTLSSSDIESITVLKDATATSIYGARAANGVIVITTKQGKAGKTSVSFTAKLGFQKRPSINSRYKLTNRDQNIELSTEALLNNYKEHGAKSSLVGINEDPKNQMGFEYTPEGMRKFMAAYTGFDLTNDTNWYDEVSRTGFYQEYGVSVQGGAPSATSAKYYFAFNYLSDESTIIGKDLERYSLRLNFDQSPSKFVKYGMNTNLSLTEINMGAGGGYFTDPITLAYQNSPLSPVKVNGEWNMDTSTGENPVAMRSKLGNVDNSKQYRAIVSPYLQLNITDKLTAMSRFGLDFYYLDEFGYWSFLSSQGAGMNGLGENTNSTRTLLSITNTVNYIDVFAEKHNFNLLIGQEGQKTMTKEAYLAGSNYPIDYLSQVANTSVPSETSTRKEEVKLNSFFANLQYDYLSKYYLSASFRYDGSSRLGKDNRWAPFWSVGAKYRLTEESYMNFSESWLNDLTLRMSYGTTGNQEVGSGWYAARGLFDFGYNYGGLPGSGQYQFSNPKLKWEQTNKFNVGVDISLFDFLSIEMVYYNHKTKDMVFAVPTSRVTGLKEIYENMGELANSGFEMSINANLLKNKNVNWNVTLTGAKNKNKVKKLSSDLPIEKTTTIIEVGKPLQQFKMKEWAGVDPQTGNGLWYLNASGDEITSDYNAAAKRYVGNAEPKFVGSVSSNIEWKNFDFGFQLNYSLGGKIYGNSLRYDEQIGGAWTANYTKYVYDNRWQKPGDKTDVPRLRAFDTKFENNASSRFLMKGDYLKIRSLSFGYKLPKQLISKAYLSNARVFVNAENLYTFSRSDYRGFDPSSVGYDGMQWWNTPQSRNVVFGVTLGF